MGFSLGSLLGQNDFHATAQNQDVGTDPGTQTAYEQAVLNAQRVGGPAPTLTGVQEGVDRGNVLGSLAQNGQLVSQLQQQAAGNGPSAAMQIYKNTADQNAQRGMGMAASGNVAPGQRAALLGQAVAGAAAGNQVAAGGAAAMRSQEQNQATQMLGGAIGQQTSGYGALLGGTQGIQAANQQSANAAQGINAQTAQANANNMGAITKGAISSAGMMAGGM